MTEIIFYITLLLMIYLGIGTFAEIAPGSREEKLWWFSLGWCAFCAIGTALSSAIN